MLFIPGSNARAMDKAAQLDADMIAFDLEDAVAPDHKAAARDAAVQKLGALKDSGKVLAVRINGLGSPWGTDDLRAAAHAPAGAVLVPKVSAPEDLLPVQAALDEAASQARIWAMIETPRGVLQAEAIAAAREAGAPRLEMWVMGLNDLALEMRLQPGAGRAALRPAMAHCLLAARAYGLEILDGVYNNFSDEAGLRAECAEGRALGFDGKSLIHPAQIGPCHEVFSPTDEEVAAARKIVSGAEAAGPGAEGAIAVDGVMVEALHVAAARRILSLAEGE